LTGSAARTGAVNNVTANTAAPSNRIAFAIFPFMTSSLFIVETTLL
jgi:hypothetical protein